MMHLRSKELLALHHAGAGAGVLLAGNRARVSLGVRSTGLWSGLGGGDSFPTNQSQNARHKPFYSSSLWCMSPSITSDAHHSRGGI